MLSGFDVFIIIAACTIVTILITSVVLIICIMCRDESQYIVDDCELDVVYDGIHPYFRDEYV